MRLQHLFGVGAVSCLLQKPAGPNESFIIVSFYLMS
jgi:hypothetical protein